MKEFRVIATGGRNYAGRAAVDRELSALVKEHGRALRIAQGGAPGLDELVKFWCEVHGTRCVSYRVKPAIDGDWPQAGNNRNARMFADFAPQLILAFPGGRGTAHMKSLGWRMVREVS